MNSALTRYREAHDKSLKDIGDLFGVNKSTILRWEKSGVPENWLVEVSDTLGIPVKKLRPDLHRIFK